MSSIINGVAEQTVNTSGFATSVVIFVEYNAGN